MNTMIVSQQWVPAHEPDLDVLLRAWKLRWPGAGILALLPEAEKDIVPLLQARCRGLSMPLIGALFPALVANDGFHTDGLWLVCFDSMPTHFLVPDLASGDVRPLARAIRQALPGGRAPILFMLFDSMLPNVSSLLYGLYEELGKGVCYAGVCAGSESFQPMPCLFDGESLIGGGVLAMLLGDEVGTLALRHDYPVSETLMRATSSQGNRVEHIDGRPAFAVYQEVIRREFGIDLTHDNFYDYAVHFPFGLITAVDVLVRIPVAFDEAGSLWCVGEVPPNSLLRLLKAPPAENSRCIASLAATLEAGQDAVQGHPVLTFYCAGRRMHLGTAAVSEVDQLVRATGASSLVGALSLGEIDQESDLHIPRFHNAAIVCLSLPAEAGK